MEAEPDAVSNVANAPSLMLHVGQENESLDKPNEWYTFYT